MEKGLEKSKKDIILKEVFRTKELEYISFWDVMVSEVFDEEVIQSVKGATFMGGMD